MCFHKVLQRQEACLSLPPDVWFQILSPAVISNWSHNMMKNEKLDNAK